MDKQVFKKVLKNGLTILVRPCHTIPKVSTQLWYSVGSKHEKTGEKGLAHLIEHMIFKGTTSLTESDINEITHKLSGSCNAFTSYDYTGYLFDFPSQNWKAALPIMADCMRNCTFKTEMLNSELKAVVQELKMYRDDYKTSLLEEMLSQIFPDHPYHHPIIGYKQDLWSLNRERLVDFYKKHYIPNNATLIVVGDVAPEDVFKEAESHFGPLSADREYQQESFYLNRDIVSRSVRLFRDVKQTTVMLAWVVPGSTAKMDYVLDIITWILAAGKGSRLYKKLVDELHLVTDIEAFNYDLFDHGLFFISFQPKEDIDSQRVIQLIHDEIENILKNKLRNKEITRARKQVDNEFLSLLENNQKQAYLMGKLYLATGDEQALFTYSNYDPKQLEGDIYDMLALYCRHSVTHYGELVPLRDSERESWASLQQLSDQEDTQILSGKERELPVESAQHAHTITPAMPKVFRYPKRSMETLGNGLRVLWCDRNVVEKVDAIMSLRTKYFYDPEDKPGLSNFMSAVLIEGTKKHSASELAQAFENLGMGLYVGPGTLSLTTLSPDFGTGLSLVQELLEESIFETASVERVRAKLLADVRNYWDSPVDFATEFVRRHIYEGHPYSKSKLGTVESIASITRDDLWSWYKRSISPCGARVGISGDVGTYDVPSILEKTWGTWQGPEVAALNFPKVRDTQSQNYAYNINRDQVVLCFAGKSISRLHPDYDKLLLFDQIFGGGVLGSMSSRLFQLREQTGLFYTIAGSLIYGADEQPGMAYVRTIVSLDRLQEAENVIRKTIETVADSMTQDEFKQAQNALANALVDNFASNSSIAASFLAMDRYNLPEDYFDTRAQDFTKLSFSEVQEAVKRVLDVNRLATFKIGRVK
ncbi:insulinase family protein [Candidatus Babeliales bacterium]|nr:insulinase family protein [Candidatus Babeliales bacterium]